MTPRIHRQGFTLVQLLVAMATLAMLLAVALPSYQAAVAAARSGDAKARLHSAILEAQREAFARNRHVVLCSSGGGGDCVGSTQWELGYIAFVDLDRDRSRGPGEALVLAVGPAGEGVRLRSSSGRTRLVLQPNGGASAGSNVSFVLCDDRGPGRAQGLVLANSGRLRQAAPPASRLERDCSG